MFYSFLAGFFMGGVCLGFLAYAVGAAFGWTLHKSQEVNNGFPEIFGLIKDLKNGEPFGNNEVYHFSISFGRSDENDGDDFSEFNEDPESSWKLPTEPQDWEK